MNDAQQSALKVVVILVEYVLVSLRLSLVRYGFVEVWGASTDPLVCTENVAGIHACIRGGAGVSGSP